MRTVATARTAAAAVMTAVAVTQAAAAAGAAANRENGTAEDSAYAAAYAQKSDRIQAESSPIKNPPRESSRGRFVFNCTIYSFFTKAAI